MEQMNNIVTVPKEVIQRRLNATLKESLDLVARMSPELLEDFGFCLAFVRQILQQKFDMDLIKYEEHDEYSRARYPAQD